MSDPLELRGVSLIAGRAGERHDESFRAYQPANGHAIEPGYYSASDAELDEAARMAAEAAPVLAASSGADRAALLRAMADGIDAAADALVERAHLETALPRPRLTGEVARTSNQLRLFADVVAEGSWVMARIDTANEQRTPPKPDIRSMLRPLGPVAVFGASNFPLAFSVAGGDTASALAGGNPVIVKAHPAHPGTSELAGLVLTKAIASCGFPGATFSLLFDAGTRVGGGLVLHPLIRAVGFTGSFKGGRAMMDLAASREEPIPVYAEMGSVNPVFILPARFVSAVSRLRRVCMPRSRWAAASSAPSLEWFFWTRLKPGFLEKLRALTAEASGFALLSSGIAERYRNGLGRAVGLRTTEGQRADAGFAAQAALLETDYAAFTDYPALARRAVWAIDFAGDGHESRTDACGRAISARTSHGYDSRNRCRLARIRGAGFAILETKVGRVIFNGFPTGVEVTHAMVHGGPYPATSDGRSTSVGSQAILRFARPVCYQNLPQHALPAELKDDNPRGILRLWNGNWQRN